MLRPLLDQEPQWSSANMPKDFAEFVDEIKPTGSDIVITKRQWGAFYGTDLDLQLRRRGVSTVVLCGISTNIGVETTAREAYQHGYNQVFAIDAMTAMSKEEHESTLKFVFPRIGLVRTTEQVLEMIG
jgi:nicotinamidase-related amidase